jgi:ribosomal protein L37E
MMVLRNNDDGAIAATGVGGDESRLSTKALRITCRRVERNSTLILIFIDKTACTFCFFPRSKSNRQERLLPLLLLSNREYI